ncbi:lytic transglycosylase, partial [Mycobacterium intracellulare]|uniref:lytic transglycosylase n=1 Tax=Mycobacterium intracellulare TaxID=1767 RepID=UPI001FF8E907
VITDTRSGVAAIAPATGTPAGKRELVTHLQNQLDRAKALLRISERRNMELAALIGRGAGGYGAGMGAMPMGGLGAAGGGAGSPLSIPCLDTALSGLTRNHHHTNPEPDQGLNLAAEPAGLGADRVRAAIRKALDIEGVHDPVARARWEAGMMLVAKRESGYRNDAINHTDANAQRGDPSGGSFQFTGPTFRQYHQPGTSSSRFDDVSEACAFINYARGRYHVAADASNLADNIQQADPTRPPKGY